MMLKACELKEKVELEAEDIPPFCGVFFYRDTALTLTTFFHNHINGVGGKDGLEQVHFR